MAHFTFLIPGKKEDLLRSSVNDEYSVKNVSLQKEIPDELKNCRLCLREEGAEFILDSFDTYYSVLHHGDSLSMDLIYRAFEDLQKGAIELNKALGFLLDDKDNLDDEVRAKYVNILKMLIYSFTQIVLLIEKRNSARREQLISQPKGKKKSSKDADDEFEVDKKGVLLVLNNIIQRELSLFWEGQAIEENFINLISGICYELLQNPMIKKEKEEFKEIFNVLGYLLKAYNHGTTFIVRLTQLIKLHEHLVQCVPKGIQQLVLNFNYKGLLHEFIEELTEWQTDENHQDPQGARHCATVLSSLAALMPNLMMAEVVSLNNYLYYEPANLRISVIMVMVEVILSNLTSHALEDEQKKFRDELLEILIEHTNDNSALVRGRVFSQWARLQKEMAIPLKFQVQVLEKAVMHLCDNSPVTRKFAGNCVTTFLSYNAFSANLSLSSMREELEKNKKLLIASKEQLNDPKMDQLMELQAQWDKIVEPLKIEVDKEINRGKENEDEEQQNRIPLSQVPEIIKMYLGNDQLKEAVQVVKLALKDNKFIEQFKQRSSVEDLDFYMNVFYTIFFDVSKIVGQLENREFANVSEEDYRKLDSLAAQVDFLKQCVEFLSAMDKAIDTMVELLETTSISDMHEAIEFFTAAYKFNIDRASDGILAMFRLMQRKEQERKDAVIAAFKNIYLLSDSQNLTDHVSVVINRLLRLIRTLPVNNLDDLQEIVSDWIAKGTLDNNCINHLWQIVTQATQATEEDEIAAVVLLKMAALGRKSIISMNINLMTSIAFSDRGKNNLQFLGNCCELLAVAYEKVDVNSKNPPFKIKSNEQCFTDLVTILTELFFKPVEFYHIALYGGIDFVYKLSSKPEHFADQLLQSLVPKLKKKQLDDPDCTVPHYALIRLCQMCGYIAIKELEFMDDTVYKELKRRQNMRDERKKNKSTKISKKQSRKQTNKSHTAISSFETSVLDESVMEGAQAEDMDADFILNVLEKDIVTGSGYLAQMALMIIRICERPDLFSTIELQFAGVTALARYMLVSSEFCKKHIRLLFTIFEKTEHPDIKTNILVHISDLLTRFPNIIEPWTDRLFKSLNDPVPQTRRSTFFSLSNLILRDMIRAYSHIPKMAAVFADEDETLRTMCKTFFLKLSHKENNLYNTLPDIFAHFVEENICDDQILKSTMSTLFDMVENPKHIENIVVRFCAKFRITDDNRQQRLISYCLTLIKYNHIALRTLIEEFPVFKHLVTDEEIYANFRTIIQNCSKQVVGKADLKPIATELESLIKSVFEINEDGSMPPPPVPKSAKKKQQKGRKTKGRKNKRRRSGSESENDSD